MVLKQDYMNPWNKMAKINGSNYTKEFGYDKDGTLGKWRKQAFQQMGEITGKSFEEMRESCVLTPS